MTISTVVSCVICVAIGGAYLANAAADWYARRLDRNRRAKGGNGGSATVGGSGIAIGGGGGSGDQPGEDGKAIVKGRKT